MTTSLVRERRSGTLFRDTATFDKPHQYATGVRYLFVNGVPAIRDGKFTGALAGKALRHEGKK